MIDKRVGKENINYLQDILTCSKKDYSPSLWSSIKYVALPWEPAEPQLTYSSQHLIAHKNQNQNQNILVPLSPWVVFLGFP